MWARLRNCRTCNESTPCCLIFHSSMSSGRDHMLFSAAKEEFSSRRLAKVGVLHLTTSCASRHPR
jgi:hypothetical protein